MLFLINNLIIEQSFNEMECKIFIDIYSSPFIAMSDIHLINLFMYRYGNAFVIAIIYMYVTLVIIKSCKIHIVRVEFKFRVFDFSHSNINLQTLNSATITLHYTPISWHV